MAFGYSLLPGHLKIVAFGERTRVPIHCPHNFKGESGFGILGRERHATRTQKVATVATDVPGRQSPFGTYSRASSPQSRSLAQAYLLFLATDPFFGSPRVMRFCGRRTSASSRSAVSPLLLAPCSSMKRPSPNPRFEGTAEKLRFSVPRRLRRRAAPQARRWAS
jgi:hypothetical protein